jgi:hypothetical protein|tara:strand:- start:317 stop:529 length:213 start_codon:yes stop_codon:yes gene_type:complete
MITNEHADQLGLALLQAGVLTKQTKRCLYKTNAGNVTLRELAREVYQIGWDVELSLTIAEPTEEKDDEST